MIQIPLTLRLLAIPLTALLWHPIKVASTLLQLGHEPIPPHESYSFITREYSWHHPRLFGYMYGITRQRGLLGWYRGFVPSVIESMVQNVVYKYSKSHVVPVVDHLLPEGALEVNVDDLTTNRNQIKQATKAFLVLSVAGCLTEVITRPFTVITLRGIAQHVGQETMYSSILQAVRHIYNEEGIAGFYSGLVPALLWHVMNSLMHQLAFLALTKAVVLLPSFLKIPLADFHMRWSLSYFFSWAGTHPLGQVSTLMAVNGSGLAAVSVQFSDWCDCWDHLSTTGNLIRGFWYFRIVDSPLAHIH